MPLHSHDVAVIVLNYNGADDTITCLCALQRLSAKPGCVIIVDNHSQDDSVERLRRWLEQAGCAEYTLLALPENGGYAAGNNAGIRLALQDSACRAVWILNNDTEPEPHALQALCDRLNERPDAGIAGSTLVYAHDRVTMQCAGGFALSRLTGATPAAHGGEPLERVTHSSVESVKKTLAYLSGASMLVRREVFEVAGLLPEEYFLYYEDAAFCLNAQKAGYRLAWAPDSIVFHKEGGSTGAESAVAGRALQRSRFVDYLALRNRIYLIRRYFPWSLPVVAASYAVVMLNRLRRGQGARLPLVFKALLDGLCGRMGKPEGSRQP